MGRRPSVACFRGSTHRSAPFRTQVRVARLVHVRGVPCIVHCSDGWDRTPQVTATAQLLLDPHFRTSAGFVDLLHKEFLSFGHKMAQRCGFKAQGPDSHDFSPIVLQWLDCVHQVVIQCPSAFEYTPAFLATVADLLYSGAGPQPRHAHAHCVAGPGSSPPLLLAARAGFVGETLCDSERERDHRCVRETTLSLARLCNGLGPACLNAAYAPVESMLTVDARPVSMRLWREWFLRWDLRTRAVALYAERSHLARRARRTRRESQTRAADAAGSAADTSADGSAAQPKLGHPTTVSAVAWVPDHASTHCSECHLPFSLLRRLRRMWRRPAPPPHPASPLSGLTRAPHQTAACAGVPFVRRAHATGSQSQAPGARPRCGGSAAIATRSCSEQGEGDRWRVVGCLP